jgi:hypothetical protein
MVIWWNNFDQITFLCLTFLVLFHKYGGKLKVSMTEIDLVMQVFDSFRYFITYFQPLHEII